MPVRRRARATRSGSSRSIIPNFLDKLEWRIVGPFRGGRVVAVAGDPTRPRHLLLRLHRRRRLEDDRRRAVLGATSPTASSSAPRSARSPSRRPTRTSSTSAWARRRIRGNVSHGDGVYKSTDAGKTWTHLGLEETRNIGKVRVHPTQPRHRLRRGARPRARAEPRARRLPLDATAARPGSCVLYRERATPARSTSRSTRTTRASSTPSIWEAARGPHYLVQRRPGQRPLPLDRRRRHLDRARRDKPGLPKGMQGQDRRRGLAGAAPAASGRSSRHEEGGVFRSDDGGETWERLSEDRNLRQRAWYYSPHLRRPAGRRDRLGAQRRDVAARSTAARPSSRCRPRTATTTTSGSTRRTRSG